MVSYFLPIGKTVFELAQGLPDSKTSDLSYSYEALVRKEAFTISQDRVFISFSYVLSLSSVLGRFMHLCCCSCSDSLKLSPPPLFPHVQYICCNFFENRGEIPSLITFYQLFLGDIKVKINSWCFLCFACMCPLLLFDLLTLSVFSKWKMYGGTHTDIPGKFCWYRICSSQVLILHTSKNWHFRLLLLDGFLAWTQVPQ